MSVQRQSAPPPEEADLETTAELPVLDVTTYEAGLSATPAPAETVSTATVAIAGPLVSSSAVSSSAQEHDFLNNTDTWIIPPPMLRVALASPSEAANATLDENRNRLEANLQALSSTLREVEDRLRRKDERLAEIERALETALNERKALELRSRNLTDELDRVRGAAAAAEARTGTLESQLQESRTLNETAQAREAQLQGQLTTRHQEFETKLAARERALALAQQDLTEARSRTTGYLETLRSNEGRRSVYEDLLSTLDRHVEERDTRLERLQSEQANLMASVAALEAALLAAKTHGEGQEKIIHLGQGRAEELEVALAGERRRVEQLESEVAAVRAELQSAVAALRDAGTERNDHMARLAAGEARIQELESRVDDQQETVRLLQAECNANMARSKELEGDLQAAEDAINRLEGDARNKSARVDELEKMNQDWRVTVDEARHALADRDTLIRRLEEETANSAVLIGHIQKSITRLDHDPEYGPEPPPDGGARLLVRTDGDSEVVHVLGRKTSVGRTPDNDLQIDAKFISRHHAVILVGPAHAIIEDLNSTNGVLVNNHRVTRQPLKDGDHVTIGKTQFRFAVRPAIDRH